MFALGQFATAPGGAASATAQDYKTFLTDNFGSAASLIEKYYPLSAFNATPFPAFFAIEKVLTDATYLCSSYRGLNRAVEKGIPVWTYLFSHDPVCSWFPGLPQKAVPLVGATHSAEIPFVFGNTVGLGPNGTCNFTEQERAISATMVSAWTAMAANRDPSSGDLQWLAYTDSSKSLGINIVNATTPGYVNYTVCPLWDTVNEMLVSLSNSTMSNSTSGSNATTTSPNPSLSPTPNPSVSMSPSPSVSTRPSAAAASPVINTASWIVLVASLIGYSL